MEKSIYLRGSMNTGTVPLRTYYDTCGLHIFYLKKSFFRVDLDSRKRCSNVRFNFSFYHALHLQLMFCEK